MKKILGHICFSFFVLVGFFMLFNTTQAISTYKSFGGKITDSKASGIKRLENSNYKCAVPGTSIEINPVNKTDSKSYLIPTNVRSKTNNQVRVNQQLLGLYTMIPTVITCIYQGYPPTTQTVNLKSFKLFGNSAN